MTHSILNLSNVKTWGLCTLLSLLSACSDLSVFVNSPLPRSLKEISSLEVNEEGKLRLEWILKDNAPKSSYDIYLLEVSSDDSLYAFSEAATINAPLKTEELTIPLQFSPYYKGKLLESTDDSETVLNETIRSGNRYALEIVEKKRQKTETTKVILLQASFNPIQTASASLEDEFIQLQWTAVPAANRYEVYADETMSLLLGSSLTNQLQLTRNAYAPINVFYVRAFRGLLAAKDNIKVALAESPVKIMKVSSTTANGLFGIARDLDFEVSFSANVTVYGDSFLPLRTDNFIRKAMYVSGSGTNKLLFRYQTLFGDDSAELDSIGSLDGEYFDVNGLSIAVALPSSGQMKSLKDTSDIAIDATAPSSPLSPGFTSPYSNLITANLSWGNSNDAHFSTHHAKLCSSNDCTTGCLPSIDSLSSPLTMTAVHGNSYYGCVQGEDVVGNRSAFTASLGTLTIDTQAPAAGSISIDANAPLTHSTAVTLTLTATDNTALEMYLSNVAGCATGGSWEAFAASKSWVLGQSDTTATVYVRFRDAAGNMSACMSDSIAHTTAPSAISIAIQAGASSTGNISPTINLSATDASEMYLTNSSSCNSGGSWVAYNATPTWTLSLDGNSNAAVYVKFRSVSAVESPCISDSIAFVPNSLVSNGDFETGNLSSWTVSLPGKWIVDNTAALNGSYSIHTNGFNDNDAECFEQNVDLTSATVDHFLSYRWSFNTEPHYDYAKFFVDAVETYSETGLNPGSDHTFTLAKGAVRNIKWCYAKDFSDSVANEFVKIDDIRVYPQTLLAPLTFKANPLNQKVDLTLTAKTGTQVGYMIVRSTNPVSFSPLNGTNYSTGPQGTDEIIYKAPGLSYSDSSLTNSVTYYYAAYSYDVNNNYSSPLLATAVPFAVQTPLTLAAAYQDSHSLLGWTVAGGGTETNYLLVRNLGSAVSFVPTQGVIYSPGPETGGTVVYAGTALSFDDLSLTNGSKYYYSLWSYTAGGTYSLAARAVTVTPTSYLPTLYQDHFYGGYGVALSPGSYNLAALNAAGIQNDDITSFRVPAGFTVIAYQGAKFDGPSWTFTSDTQTVPNEINDQMSSVIILAP